MIIYPALEPHNTTCTRHPVALQFAAHDLSAETPVRVTVTPPTYVPLAGSHPTELHRAAQAAARDHETALRMLGEV